MDQLSAHLDRAWDLAQRGDARGADMSARQALDLAPDSPEVHNLIGYVAALEGDCNEAVEAYQQAIFLDDTYIEAMLNAAELMVHPLGQLDEAMWMCEQVLDLTDYVDEVIDASLLKFEALVGKGEMDAAKRVLASLPEGPYESPTHNYLAGRAHFETGNREAARVLIEAAIEGDLRNPEAYYYAGLLCEDRGDRQNACAAFLRTRQLELEMGMPPWAPDGETFLKLTERAVADLPPELQTVLQSAELYIADLPGSEVVVDGVDPRTMVLVDAAVLGPEDEGETADIPSEQLRLRVFLYALNIMHSAGSLDAIGPCIREALVTELEVTLGELADELAEQLGTPIAEPSEPSTDEAAND
ncbi:MAG: UDP-N-acetylglucosamine-peptide N-acetylglucosaminyltransferase [Deltaproteobacteria bacterium]|nr:MAG: UDP-N-acetylglucosamine-peptide N-acetylglucosaminyltransferase [Deltaproteobacteria bacterium]